MKALESILWHLLYILLLNEKGRGDKRHLCGWNLYSGPFFKHLSSTCCFMMTRDLSLKKKILLVMIFWLIHYSPWKIKISSNFTGLKSKLCTALLSDLKTTIGILALSDLILSLEPLTHEDHNVNILTSWKNVPLSTDRLARVWGPVGEWEGGTITP